MSGQAETGVYVHGSAPEEQARLSLLNRLMNDACLRVVNVRPGERVLDIGSGLGQFSRAMGRAGARVVGVERDAAQLAEARRQAREDGEEGLVEFRAGDAFEPPLSREEWGSFDAAHTRFVLEHVPRPVDVVRQMARAVRAGGRVILLDDDHEPLRMWPESAALEKLWRAYWRTYSVIGNDPVIGRKLPEILHRAGVRPVRSDMVFFGACAGSDTFDPLVENFGGVMRTAVGTMTREGLLSAGEIEAGFEALGEWRRAPGAALWYAIFVAEGVVEGTEARRHGGTKG